LQAEMQSTSALAVNASRLWGAWPSTGADEELMGRQGCLHKR